MRPKDDDQELLEDNVRSVEVFQRMHTQWERGGMNGARSGLKYESLPLVMKRCHVSDEDFDQVFDDVQIMEDVALKVAADK